MNQNIAFHWVKLKGRWLMGWERLEGGVTPWRVVGDPYDYERSAFDEIGPRLGPPVYRGEEADPAACIERIAAMYPGRWDGVDVGKWLAEERGREEPTGWQPIESAPRDGTHVVLYGDPGQLRPFVGRYYESPAWRSGWLDADDVFNHPTHWMPLPAAPEPLPLVMREPGVIDPDHLPPTYKPNRAIPNVSEQRGQIQRGDA